jgi:hypothetical protein
MASFPRFRLQEGRNAADYKHADDNFRSRFQYEGKEEGRSDDPENY